MSKHTPGPWHAKIDKYGNASIFAKDVCVADCLKREADLIAAAPELMEAWRRLLEYCDDSDGSQYGTISTSLIRVLGKDAIAKATGEQS